MHTGPCSPRTPSAAAACISASTPPSASSSRAVTGLDDSNATRTHASWLAARTSSTRSPPVSRSAAWCNPGATTVARPSSETKPLSPPPEAPPPPSAASARLSRLRRCASSARPFTVAAPQAHASKRNATASRTRRARSAGSTSAGPASAGRASARRLGAAGRGTDRRLFLDRVHPAAALEFDAAIDEQGRGVEISDHLARGMDLDRVLRADVPVNDSAPDDDGRDLDLGVDFRAITDDERVFAQDFALEDPVDSYASLEVELPLELSAAPEQGGDLRGRELLFHAWGLPGRGPVGQLSGARGRAERLDRRSRPAASCWQAGSASPSFAPDGTALRCDPGRPDRPRSRRRRARPGSRPGTRRAQLGAASPNHRQGAGREPVPGLGARLRAEHDDADDAAAAVGRAVVRAPLRALAEFSPAVLLQRALEPARALRLHEGAHEQPADDLLPRRRLRRHLG